jgi:hypothetical protein
MSDVTQASTIAETLLPRRLPVLGNVKIGGVRAGSGDTKIPVKFDHFRIVRRTRGSDGNFELDTAVHANLPEKPTVLDVRLPFDTRAENFRAQMVHYKGKTQQTHRCDGVTCVDPSTQASRPCDRAAGRTCPCKPYGRLALFLEAAPAFGGIYLYRTTSWETVSGMQTFLGNLEKEFPLGLLPLRLELYPSEITYGLQGQKKTGTAYRVALTLRASWEQTRAAAIEYQRQNQIARTQLRQLTAGARTEIDEIDAADAEEIGAEFFPDAEAQAAATAAEGAKPASKVGQMNEELIEERIGELRGLIARAEASKVTINTHQMGSLTRAIESRDVAKLDQSIEWTKKKLGPAAAEQPSLLES